MQGTPSRTNHHVPELAAKSFRNALGLGNDDGNESDSDGSTSTTRSLPVGVVGHRGSVFEYLENTREGFLRCAQLGVAIELDVFQVAGTVVVFHGGGTDEDPGQLGQYCVGAPQAYIADCSLAEVQGLRFDPAYEEFPCPKEMILDGKVPTLVDVLQDLRDYPATQLKIELKGSGGKNFVRSVISLVEEHNMQDRCAYSSFQLPFLKDVREYRSYPTTAALFSHPVPEDYLQQSNGCDEIHLPYDACSVDRVREVRQAGFRSMAWFRGPKGMKEDLEIWGFSTEEECYPDLIRAGVDEICCNKPHQLMTASKMILNQA